MSVPKGAPRQVKLHPAGVPVAVGAAGSEVRLGSTAPHPVFCLPCPRPLFPASPPLPVISKGHEMSLRDVLAHDADSVGLNDGERLSLPRPHPAAQQHMIETVPE